MSTSKLLLNKLKYVLDKKDKKNIEKIFKCFEKYLFERLLKAMLYITIWF
jgi:hypothetical protein